MSPYHLALTVGLAGAVTLTARAVLVVVRRWRHHRPGPIVVPHGAVPSTAGHPRSPVDDR